MSLCSYLTLIFRRVGTPISLEGWRVTQVIGPGQCGLARLAVTGIFLALLWDCWCLSIWHLFISMLLSKLKTISVFLYLYHENIFDHHLEMWEHETSTIINATVFLSQKFAFLHCRKRSKIIPIFDYPLVYFLSTIFWKCLLCKNLAKSTSWVILSICIQFKILDLGLFSR